MKTKKKKLEISQKTTRKPRSDREPGHVIIGNHGNGKLNKHLVSQQQECVVVMCSEGYATCS